VSRREDVNVPEMAREAAFRALDDAGLTPRDVDAFIIGSAPEIFEGVNYPENWIAPALGASGKPVMRIHTGGTVGASTTIAGYYHVACGMFDVVLAVAYQKTRSGTVTSRAERLASPACRRGSTSRGTPPASARSMPRW
jgi:acetyl-CoA C-acetyltransferase